MNKPFQQTIQTVEALSPAEQIELIKVIFAHLVTQPNEKLTLFEMIFQFLRDMLYPINDTKLPSQAVTTRNGVPLFPKQPHAQMVTMDLVNELRDELPW